MDSTIINELEEKIKTLPWEKRSEELKSFIERRLEENDLDVVSRGLGLFSYGLIDETVITLSNIYLRRRIVDGWSIIASFDTDREPAEKEIIIYYGNYPHSVECLPATQKVYRHPIYFTMIEHSEVEYNLCWKPVERIYILTTASRLDRYFHILLELCRVAAPLHRIYKYCGGFKNYTGNLSQDKYICASQNHVDVTSHFMENKYEYCVVLEDDFSFISDIRFLHDSLHTFFQRCDSSLITSTPYNSFYVCFLSYSKWGAIEPGDDLISYNKQPCTTSSGYILKKSTVKHIMECQIEGVECMKRGGAPVKYCCDRYWCKYCAHNTMVCFKRKLGFQYVTHSDIVNRINIHFD